MRLTDERKKKKGRGGVGFCAVWKPPHRVRLDQRTGTYRLITTTTTTTTTTRRRRRRAKRSILLELSPKKKSKKLIMLKSSFIL